MENTSYPEPDYDSSKQRIHYGSYGANGAASRAKSSRLTIQLGISR